MPRRKGLQPVNKKWFPEDIEALRAERRHGVTLQELADRHGVSRGRIQALTGKMGRVTKPNQH